MLILPRLAGENERGRRRTQTGHPTCRFGLVRALAVLPRVREPWSHGRLQTILERGGRDDMGDVSSVVDARGGYKVRGASARSLVEEFVKRVRGCRRIRRVVFAEAHAREGTRQKRMSLSGSAGHDL